MSSKYTYWEQYHISIFNVKYIEYEYDCIFFETKDKVIDNTIKELREKKTYYLHLREERHIAFVLDISHLEQNTFSLVTIFYIDSIFHQVHMSWQLI